MSLIFISQNSFPNYIATSTDVVNSKIAGASSKGFSVFLTDTKEWFVINSDLTLVPFYVSSTTLLSDSYATLDVGGSKFAIVGSDEYHCHVHSGTLWAMTYYQSSLSQGATVVLGISTGIYSSHCAMTFVSNGDAKIDFYAGAEFNSGLSALIFNHNCGIETLPATTIFSNPVVTDEGILKRSLFIPGGAGGNRTGGLSPFSNEFIIPPNKKIKITYTNLDGAGGIFNAVMDFYEL